MTRHDYVRRTWNNRWKPSERGREKRREEKRRGGPRYSFSCSQLEGKEEPLK
jgi:hypothetical protein